MKKFTAYEYYVLRTAIINPGPYNKKSDIIREIEKSSGVNLNRNRIYALLKRFEADKELIDEEDGYYFKFPRTSKSLDFFRHDQRYRKLLLSKLDVLYKNPEISESVNAIGSTIIEASELPLNKDIAKELKDSVSKISPKNKKRILDVFKGLKKNLGK